MPYGIYTLWHTVSATPEATASPLPTVTPIPLTEKGKALLLSSGGRALVLEFETGGERGYDPHPEWPGGSSGVTAGVGYDMGYYSRSVILSDWAAIKANDRNRLAETSGKKGQRARELIPGLRDIFIRWDIATDVFDRVDVAREFDNAKRAIPGFLDLRPNAQAAWLSLGFNRGWSFSGPNRVEMRAARDLVPARDYEAMANQFRKMVRVWLGMPIERGMTRRRNAEADLLLTP